MLVMVMFFFFYFCGHGRNNNRQCFSAIDIRLIDELTNIDIQRLIRNVSERVHLLFVINACDCVFLLDPNRPQPTYREIMVLFQNLMEYRLLWWLDFLYLWIGQF